jgi:hypothetical protein
MLFLAIAVILTGCSTPSKNLNKLSVGMTKAEVIQVLGEPESTRASSGVEFLIYSLKERMTKPFETPLPFPIAVQGKYFVKLVQGRVESYGQVGDFDSTKPIETKQQIDLNVK